MRFQLAMRKLVPATVLILNNGKSFYTKRWRKLSPHLYREQLDNVLIICAFLPVRIVQYLFITVIQTFNKCLSLKLNKIIILGISTAHFFSNKKAGKDQNVRTLTTSTRGGTSGLLGMATLNLGVLI
jgi:hypothetical protein